MANVKVMRLTIPNALTLGRVIAAPLVAFVFLALARPMADLVAFALFTIAGLSDFFDGWLARRWGQVSAFGRMLDPIADKAMVAITGAVLVAIFHLSAAVTIPVTVILLRETLVSGLREYLKGARILDVTLMAKWKTTAQMSSSGFSSSPGQPGRDSSWRKPGWACSGSRPFSPR